MLKTLFSCFKFNWKLWIFLLAFLLMFGCFEYCKGQGSCASPNGSFFSYTGGNVSYATALANGWCYTGLVAGQTYCFYYYYPSSGSVEIDWQPGLCGSCGSSYILANSGCGITCCSCSMA